VNTSEGERKACVYVWETGSYIHEEAVQDHQTIGEEWCPLLANSPVALYNGMYLDIIVSNR
jgi:hypothetical protein